MSSDGGTTAVSDGTMPCPVPSPSGHPCIKHIPRGWTADEGHGGGHWWRQHEVTQAMDAGAHFDASRLLAGLPTEHHMPADCTPQCPHWTSTPAAPGSVERNEMT
jgi:hypothetical protein